MKTVLNILSLPNHRWKKEEEAPKKEIQDICLLTSETISRIRVRNNIFLKAALAKIMIWLQVTNHPEVLINILYIVDLPVKLLEE